MRLYDLIFGISQENLIRELKERGVTSVRIYRQAALLADLYEGILGIEGTRGEKPYFVRMIEYKRTKGMPSPFACNLVYINRNHGISEGVEYRNKFSYQSASCFEGIIEELLKQNNIDVMRIS